MVAPADSEDVALVDALARRDQDAMATLYQRHAKAIFDYARCTVGQRPLAEDVVQDVFVQLWKQPERFDRARGTVRSYLLTLAYGRSIDLARSETSRHRREERDEARRQAGPDELFETGWTHADEVHRALTRLTPEQREAIALAYFGGYTYREVAAFLHAPEGTIKNRIRTGLARLRDDLASTEPEMMP
jgi:RNA polymerase sigma-70 factor (ECF subfamily)